MTPSRLRARRRFNMKLGLFQSSMICLDGLGVKEVITSGGVQTTQSIPTIFQSALPHGVYALLNSGAWKKRHELRLHPLVQG